MRKRNRARCGLSGAPISAESASRDGASAMAFSGAEIGADPSFSIRAASMNAA